MWYVQMEQAMLCRWHINHFRSRLNIAQLQAGVMRNKEVPTSLIVSQEEQTSETERQENLHLNEDTNKKRTLISQMKVLGDT